MSNSGNRHVGGGCDKQENPSSDASPSLDEKQHEFMLEASSTFDLLR